MVRTNIVIVIMTNEFRYCKSGFRPSDFIRSLSLAVPLWSCQCYGTIYKCCLLCGHCYYIQNVYRQFMVTSDRPLWVPCKLCGRLWFRTRPI